MGDESNQVATFFLIAVYIISKKTKTHNKKKNKQTENENQNIHIL